MKKYEAMFILSASLKDEELEKMLERLRGEVTKVNGKILETQMMGVRTFARTLQKKDTGLYVKMYLEMEPKDIPGLRARYRLNEEIFRVQIIHKQKPVPEAKPATP